MNGLKIRETWRGAGSVAGGAGGGSRSGEDLLRCRQAGRHAAVEFVDHARHVELGFAIGRDAMVLVYRGRSGVVGRQRQGEVVVVAGEQGVEVGGSALDVLIGTKAVVDAEVGGGGGHQLHQALGSSAADGMGISVALGLHHAGEKIAVDVVVDAGLGKHLTEVILSEDSLDKLGAFFLVLDWRRGCNGFGSGRIGDVLHGGDIAGSDFDVVLVGGTGVEANPIVGLN